MPITSSVQTPHLQIIGAKLLSPRGKRLSQARMGCQSVSKTTKLKARGVLNGSLSVCRAMHPAANHSSPYSEFDMH